MAHTATDLRKNIYKLLDQVLEEGRPIEIMRRGRLLRISAVDGTPPVERVLPLDDLIAGDPAELEHLDWSAEWKP